jgi:hypothetical protein
MASSSRACPPQAESWCSRDSATTECEFDLARKSRLPNRLEPWIADKGRIRPAHARPQQPDGVLDHVKAKPLRGGPHGPASTCSPRAISTVPRSGRRAGLQSNKELTNRLDTFHPHVSNPQFDAGRMDCFVACAPRIDKKRGATCPTPRRPPRPRGAAWPIALPPRGCCPPRSRRSRIAATAPAVRAARISPPRPACA